jgi:hypothetical protein
MPFIETSAKASLNVEEAFVTMTKEIKDKLQSKGAATGVKQNTSSALGLGKPLTRPQESSTDVDENSASM